MWEMRIEEAYLKEICARRGYKLGQITLMVRATTIRDGTPGISLAIGDEPIGEWTDSRARSLALTRDNNIAVLGRDGEVLYLVVMPGIVLNLEQLSETEARVSMQL